MYIYSVVHNTFESTNPLSSHHNRKKIRYATITYYNSFIPFETIFVHCFTEGEHLLGVSPLRILPTYSICLNSSARIPPGRFIPLNIVHYTAVFEQLLVGSSSFTITHLALERHTYSVLSRALRGGGTFPHPPPPPPKILNSPLSFKIAFYPCIIMQKVNTSAPPKN